MVDRMNLFEQGAAGKRPTQDEINNTIWKACDTFRGTIDPSEYKNYILVFLFFKYLSDVHRKHEEELREQYGDNEILIKRKLERDRFVLPDGASFYDIKRARAERQTDLGDRINKALEAIETANKLKLEGVFRDIDFNSETNLGETKERNRRLEHLIDDFSDPKLDFRRFIDTDENGKEDVIGNAYMYLISKFASDAGKKGGEFYTPSEVSLLLAKLLDPQPGERIYDPTIGSGSLAITVADEVHNPDGSPSNDFAIYGQENNAATWALAKMNMFLHGIDGATIERGDTITNPKLKEGDQLMKFDVVVANPPFSLKKWGHEAVQHDQYKRFRYGLPPKSKGDFAFILHMIASAREGAGRVGVIVPHGVLFRGGAEGRIRQKLIEANLLDGVIGLPEGMFFGTGIPAAILLFKKSRSTQDVLFIDASQEYDDRDTQNRLRIDDIKKIVSAYKGYESIDKYAYLASLDEINGNEFNLNIPRYVDTFEEEKPIDLKAVQEEILSLEEQLSITRGELDTYLKELNVSL